MKLIDADNLIKLTQKDMEFAFNNGFLDMAFEREHLIKVIRNQPTAYSVENVVEELETNKQNALEVEESIKEYNVWNKAIEIVKQGGVSYDVCEWNVFDNSLTDEPQWVYKTTCGKYIGEEHTSKAFVYCPYCGKKIKEMENK